VIRPLRVDEIDGITAEAFAAGLVRGSFAAARAIVADKLREAAFKSLALTPWQRFDATARKHEPRYRAAALALFFRERESVIQRILDAPPSVKAHDPHDPHPSIADPYIEAALLKIAADYAPGGKYHEAWLARYQRLIGSTMQVGSRAVPARTGLSFNLRNQRAIDAVQRRVNRLTGNVTQTTLDRIKAVIVDAREQGQGVSVVAKRIREEAFDGEVSRHRSQTIARTETVGALNEGAWVQATTDGVMQSKRWLDQQDGRVRDSHVTAAGAGWIALGDVFPNGLRYPHEAGAPAAEVVNCRCALAYSDLPPRPT